jgi:hypothetical protein
MCLNSELFLLVLSKEEEREGERVTADAVQKERCGRCNSASIVSAAI